MGTGVGYGITILYEPACSDDVLYDLVAIHGLNGDAFETWTHKESRVMWLRDLLPRELPNVRIMTFGYNARLRNFAGHQDLRNIATKLLSELADSRKTAKIGASCYEQTNDVATPRGGTTIADARKIIANITHACSPFRPARGLLGSLRKGSKVLFEVAEDFVERAGKLQIVSFFEMEMTSFGIFRRFVVKEQSALLCVPNEIPIGQFADHRSISRFSSVNDRNYRPVITRLLKFRQDITKKPAGFSHSSQDAQSPKSDFNSEPIFEIPFDRYFSFRGRQELIESMEKYFSQCSSSQPLIYALTGLGGSGKTHSALQYALRNRFKYKTGVVYFNASSNITLRADFHRIHDRLNLAPGGHSVEPLDEQTAVGLLLEKAAIGSPTVDNLKQATAVVRGLGYLPLAIDQAGAFIRRRQKSLKDYHRLFQDKQYEILNVAPGVSGYEKTVATLWELSFRQLEIAHPKASNILILFSFLEGNNISNTMLHRACSTKRIWGHNGEIVQITPKDAGLNQELITLLDDEMQFDNAISQLLASSLIQRNATGESSTLSVHPLVQNCASHRVSLKERQKWQVQAILLVAHAFPFSVYVDENFGVIGREMFMHIPRILKEFDQLMPDGCDQYLIVKRAVTMLLLSAAKFNFNPWKNECIRRIKDLLKDEHDCYLGAWATFTESKILRMQGKTTDSYKALENPIHNTALSGLDEDLISDVRYNATKGDLVISFAETLIKDGELLRAKAKLTHWRPLNPDAPSTMERLVLQHRDVMLGRILRNQGRFVEALSYLEKLLQNLSAEDYLVSTGWQMILVTNVTDLYSEVGKPQDAEAVLDKVLKISQSHGWYNIGTGRRLRLALIESFIRRGLFTQAEEKLKELIPIIEAIPEPDINQSTEHFRVWAGLARISHLQGQWNEALDRWNQALAIVERSGWTQGFNHGIVLYSIAQVLARVGDVTGCETSLSKAEKSLAVEERKYWIVGLGSYWYDYIVTALGSEGSSPVVNLEK
ncbi:TPR repeat [Coccidioides immitis RMSCC 2394]|uniref:TPR repeat n=1 Tax=Coccidioides immitis RMSCC 2394 TaxID=404692 RepID=A0A0J6YKD6_COCIT|nr:TPR repeat [Coccidioides immitis RMSCC 2394]